MAHQGNRPATDNAGDRNKQNPQSNPANRRKQDNPGQGDPSERGSEHTRAGQAGKQADRSESMKEETEKSRGEA